MQRKEPSVKMAKPALYRFLRPNMSARRPTTGTRAVEMSMKLRITHIIVMKSVCRWVMISGSAMSNAEPWTAASRVPIVVTDRAVHSYPCQFSLSSFMFESQLSICLMRFDDTFMPFFKVSYLLVD